MRFCLLLAFSLLAYGSTLWAQGTSPLKGEVTYITAQNVYVRFEATGPIEVRDTLTMGSDARPCLVVSAKSSSSVVASPLAGYTPNKGDVIYFAPSRRVEAPEEEEKVEAAIVTEEPEEEEGPTYERKETIRGRVTFSNYQIMASERDNRNRIMGRLWLDAENISHSRLSFELQANYRQTLQAGQDTAKRYFNVYNLAASYAAPGDWNFTLGRSINPKIASVGAIDGLQIEKTLGNYQIGAIIGSRPDQITSYPNPKLLEYGGYLSLTNQSQKVYAQTTLGVMEQRNRGEIDRRYLYLQHSSNLYRNLSLFSSAELDLFQSVNGVAQNSLRLTNLYLSATYRIGKWASLMASYDSRRRVLYYETFLTEIERLLSEDLARQGVRLRLGLRPVKNLHLNAGYSRRFQGDQQNRSNNLQGSLSYRNLPWVGGRISLAYNWNQSNYLTSKVSSVRYERDLIADKLDFEAYYRLIDYVYLNSTNNRIQHYYGLTVSFHPAPKWRFGLTGERTDFNQESNYRVYVRISRRFYRRE